MTFLEFFEALIGCAVRYVTEAVVKDPNTPRPSTSITKDESMYSIAGTPSRLTSHVRSLDSVNKSWKYRIFNNLAFNKKLV